MRTDGLALLVPERANPDRDAIARAWERAGGSVVRVARFRDPPALTAAAVHLRAHGDDAFCLVLQQKLALSLMSPPDDLLLRIPERYVRRRLTGSVLREARSITFPAFVKPASPTLYPARVHTSASEVLEECLGMPNDTPLLISEPVSFTYEARCFVLDGDVLDAAVYEGDGDSLQAVETARQVAASVSYPAAFVVDVGEIPGRGPAVIGFSPAWRAGLNGCHAEAVLPAIEAASDPRRAGGAGP